MGYLEPGHELDGMIFYHDFLEIEANFVYGMSIELNIDNAMKSGSLNIYVEQELGKNQAIPIYDFSYAYPSGSSKRTYGLDVNSGKYRITITNSVNSKPVMVDVKAYTSYSIF